MKQIVVILGGVERPVRVSSQASCARLSYELLINYSYDPALNWQLKGADGVILSRDEPASAAYELHGGPFYLSLAPGTNA